MTDQHTEQRVRRVVAEIISVGDEIVSGYILDTNAPFLSRSLADIGVRTLYHTTVCDDMAAMGVDTLYLLTDHTGFYERYGWEFFCLARGNDGALSRLYVHHAAGITP